MIPKHFEICNIPNLHENCCDIIFYQNVGERTNWIPGSGNAIQLIFPASRDAIAIIYFFLKNFTYQLLPFFFFLILILILILF